MIFEPARLLLIAGPCSLESEQICRAVAEALVAIAREHPELRIVFKGSFDKANRTSLRGARGTGLEAGLELLALVRRDYGFPVLTDVHETAQVAAVAAVCDVVQIPAFLCRQTDLLLAAAASGRTVNVKKGQFLSPAEMAHVVAKLREGGASEIWQTERGTTFGYQNLVVDMRSFALMKKNGCPAVFDATHSVQLPGAGDGRSAGQPEFIPPLARAALAAGADGLFLETHPDPSRAISDGPNMVSLAALPVLLESCLAVWRTARLWERNTKVSAIPRCQVEKIAVGGLLEWLGCHINFAWNTPERAITSITVGTTAATSLNLDDAKQAFEATLVCRLPSMGLASPCVRPDACAIISTWRSRLLKATLVLGMQWASNRPTPTASINTGENRGTFFQGRYRALVIGDEGSTGRCLRLHPPQHPPQPVCEPARATSPTCRTTAIRASYWYPRRPNARPPFLKF